MTLPKKSVLMVEDDIYFAGIVRSALEQGGFKVMFAENGEAGLKDTQRKQPDLVLLDVNLPKINGFEVLRQLKADDQTSNIPIVMLTSMGQKEDIERGFELGATQYLIKTQCTPDAIVRHVKTVLGIS